MKSQYISYLDLMCCGFGGALLMFLIVASATEKQQPTEPMLVVRCHVDRSSDSVTTNQGAELGIEYRRITRDKSKPWILASDSSASDQIVNELRDKWSFFPPTAPGQSCEAVLILRHPKPGRWEFRPYLADFRPIPQEIEADAANDDSPTSVVMEVMGASAVKPKTFSLESPGEVVRDSVEVEIKPRR